MLGTLSEDIKEFDVTIPFIMAHSSIRKHKFVKPLAKKSVLDVMLKKQNTEIIKIHTTAKKNQRIDEKEIVHEDKDDKFFLSYRDYLIKLLEKFQSVGSASNIQNEKERKKYQAIEKRILFIVNDLGNEYV